MDNPLARLRKKKRATRQVTEIRSEPGDFTNDLTEIKRIMREYYEQLHINKLDNLD